MKKLLAILILTFFSTIICCQTIKTTNQDNVKPFVLGQIEEIDSKILNEKRILNIYLPEGYNTNDTIKYSVVYLLDGSADEDFIHIVGLYQFNNFSWIDRVPKSIIVGIANINRSRDFSYETTIDADKKRNPTSGHSDKFMAFIETELQPFIQKKFKTDNNKTIIGQSMAGLFVTEILFKKPYLFNKYIIISPSLWWDNGSLLNQHAAILNEDFKQKIDIYIAVGKEGLTPTEIPRVMEVDANFLAEKLKESKSKTLNVLFDYLPQEDHATIMHQAVMNAFRQLNSINHKN